MLIVLRLQCQFRNTPHMELECGTNVLPPGAVLDVPIRFLPRELCSYHEKVTFILNSCITREVTLLGHGVKMKVSMKRCCVNDRTDMLKMDVGPCGPSHVTLSISLSAWVSIEPWCWPVSGLIVVCIFFFSQLEVEDPRQRKLNLGCLNSGSKVKKKVKLVNRSSIDLSFKLLLNTQLDQRVKNVLMGVHMRIYSHTHTDHYRPSSSHPPGSVTQPNRGAQTESRWWFMFFWNPVLSSSAPTCLHCWAAGSVCRRLLPLAHTSRLLPGTVLSFVQFHSDLDFTDGFTAKCEDGCIALHSDILGVIVNVFQQNNQNTTMQIPGGNLLSLKRYQALADVHFGRDET